MHRRDLLVFVAVALLFMILLIGTLPAASGPLAQGNPTEQKQTIDAAVGLRFTQTFRVGQQQTADMARRQTATATAIFAVTVNAAFNQALTQTAGPEATQLAPTARLLTATAVGESTRRAGVLQARNPLWTAVPESTAAPDAKPAAAFYVDATRGKDGPEGDGSQGRPFRSITYAISQINTGNVEIRVQPGVYNKAGGEVFPITMKPGVSLIANGASFTSLDGEGTDVVILFPNTVAYPRSTVISGFKITGGVHGIPLLSAPAGTSSPTIRNNWITGNTQGVYSRTVSGQSLSAYIFNNLIAGNADYGLYNQADRIKSAITSRIENNQIVNNGKGGLYCYGDSAGYDASPCAPLLIGNFVMNNAGDGIYCKGYYAGACSMTLIGNLIANNKGWGVNRVHDGSYLVPTKLTLINNTIHSNNGGVQFLPYDEAMLLNNTIANNGDFGVKTGPPLQGRDSKIVVSNTIIWGHKQRNLDVDAKSVSFSLVGDNDYGATNNNLTADPRFVNAAQGDFHLMAASPAVNAGNKEASQLPALDADGNPRVAGKSVDIGAYEVRG